MWDGKIRIQKGLTRLGSRSKSNRVAFNKDKCKGSVIRSEQQVAQTPGGEMGIIKRTPEQGLGRLTDSSLTKGQWCEKSSKEQRLPRQHTACASSGTIE